MDRFGESGNFGAESVHFTYSSPDQSVLKQGDVLENAGDLRDLISRIHPHYAEDKRVTHFQVLTQSCDLVLRAGKCASRYLTLASVRPLAAVVDTVLQGYDQRLTIDGNTVCSENHKADLKKVFEQLLNNNSKSFFFLKAAPEWGLANDSCSVFQLSIALRAYEHYEVCLKQKRVELNENFQSKLGWAVGNLYSRVGTIDYVDAMGLTKSQLGRMVENMMNEYVVWREVAKFRELKKVVERPTAGDTVIKLQDLDAAVSATLATKESRMLDDLVDGIRGVVQLDEAAARSLKNFLGQHQLITKAVRNS